MSKKLPSIPGFRAVSDLVLIRDTADEAPIPPGDPDAVLIYGWGDCQPKHIAKYADGYERLFPHSKQVVVLAPISRTLSSDLTQRTQAMRPIVEFLDTVKPANGEKLSIVAQAMSNTGATNYAATLNAYREQHNAPLPHELLVLDSTPGSPHMTWANLQRWSRAMALGTAAWFPWPFAVTQVIWGIFLCLNNTFENIVGRESAPLFSLRAVDDYTYETKESRRLYLYSKDDEIIPYEDIEGYRAMTIEKGYQTDVEIFEGTGHVGHMRVFPERYWKAISDSWAQAKKD